MWTTLSGCSVAEFRIGLMEQRLIEHFASGGTAEEAANAFGISAVEAYPRVKDSLSRIDVWTEIEMGKMNVIILQKMLRASQQGYDPTNPKSIEANAKLVQAIDKLQSKQFKLSDADIERAAVAQAEKIKIAMNLSYNKVRATLAGEFPAVPIEYIDSIFLNGIKEALTEIEGGESE